MTAQLEDPEYLADARGTPLRASMIHLSPAALRLLALAGLPLVDGVFATMVANGALSHPANLLDIGCYIFSGAGCISVATTLDGPLYARVLTVFRVYSLILLGALVEAFCLPFVAPLITPDLKPYGAILLLGVAVSLSGLPVAPAGALPQPCAARWVYCLRLLAVPQVILAMLAAISALHLVSTDLHLGAAATPAAVLHAGIAVLVGLGLTLTAAVFADLVERHVELTVVRLTGSIVLVVIALVVLGVPLPATIPLVVLGVRLRVTIPLLILVGGFAVAVLVKKSRTVLAKMYRPRVANGGEAD
jgi:hypothetical protein